MSARDLNPSQLVTVDLEKVKSRKPDSHSMGKLVSTSGGSGSLVGEMMGYVMDYVAVYNQVAPVFEGLVKGDMSNTLKPLDEAVDYPVPEHLFPSHPDKHSRLDLFIKHLKANRSDAKHPITLKINKLLGARLPETFNPVKHCYFWEFQEVVSERNEEDYSFTINFVIAEQATSCRYNRYCDLVDENFLSDVLNSILQAGHLDDHGWITG